MEILTHCPICNGTDLQAYMQCTDFTYSKKTFNISSCKACDFKFTNPRPSLNELGDYYQSEDYVSHSDTQVGLVNKLYHLVRKYTLIKKLQLVYRWVGGIKKGDNKQILDIGCGTGAFLNVCKNAGFQVTGIEPETKAREYALSKYGLTISEEHVLDTFESASFDVITLWHVLEHVPNLNERIAQIQRLLKPEGTLIVAVPNCSSYDAAHYKEYWAAYDLPRHLYHFTPTDISNLFDRHQMKVARILPMAFDSFYVSLLSEKYKSGSSNIVRAFYQGLLSNIKAIPTGKKYSSQIYILKHN